MEDNYYHNMKKILQEAPAGTVFAKVDFDAFGTDGTVRNYLSRMVKDGVCEKLLPSVYFIPARTNDKEGSVRPNPYDVVYAKARNSGWQVMPKPEIALYHFGLGDAPQKVEFWATCPTIVYHVPNCCDISFQFCSARWMRMSDESLWVVSAVTGLKESGPRVRDLLHIGRQLSYAQIERLVAEKEFAPVWMQECLDVVISAGPTMPSGKDVGAQNNGVAQSHQRPDLDSRLEQALVESRRLSSHVLTGDKGRRYDPEWPEI